MTDTIEIRRRDMVSSCPIADELEALRKKINQQEDTINGYKALNKELIGTRATLTEDLEKYREDLDEARKSRDAAEEDADIYCEQMNKARAALRNIKYLIQKYEEVPIDDNP